MTLPLTTIPFPKQQDYARMLFEEGVRHFHDAFTLHRHRRYAGSITSAIKVVEIGFKSLLMLDASATIIPDLFKTHNVYQGVILEYELYKTTHAALLDNHDRTLRVKIIDLARLIPSSQNPRRTELTEVENTEYPFFAASSGTPTVVYAPGAYYRRNHSARHLRTALELLKALQAIYPEIQAWGITV